LSFCLFPRKTAGSILVILIIVVVTTTTNTTTTTITVTAAAVLFFMVALCNRADHYIFILFLSFFLFFPRLISAVGDWMFTILRHMVWP